MSFLDQKYSATVAARLTQKGRNAISNGNFNISYFAIGDSEFNYTGSLTQKVLTPFDRDHDIKYPLWYTTGTTIYGIPVPYSITSTCNDITGDTTGWASTVVWETNPIGYTGATSYTGFTNSPYLGTKSYFGYTSTSGQTYYSSTGSTIGTTTGTTIIDTIGNQVVIKPEEQKTIAILHYTQSGTTEDPYRFFKYDDYISTSTGITYNNSLSDKQYFKVTIPGLMYHRTAGTSFYMSTGNTKMMGSNYNSNYKINYVDLVDGIGNTANTVGKVFYNQQTIVFDDEEIAAALDSSTNRTFTLPAPHVSTLVTNNDPISALTTGTTIWITYMLDGGTSSNTLPCNYYMKVAGSSNKEAVTVQFSENSFNYLNSGYTATKFYILCTLTNNQIIYNSDGSIKSNTSTPPPPLSSAQWKKMDYSTSPINLGANLSGLTSGPTFTIYNSNYTGASGTYTSTLQFTGQTGTVPTIQLVRSSDIEEMCFNLSLPINTFNYSQNPTNPSPKSAIMTEVSLLDDNKNTLVMGKLATPIQRSGAQVIQVKLDF